MKKRLFCLVCLAMVFGLAAVLPMPKTAAAASYQLQNATEAKIFIALLVPTNKGWYVSQWYTLEPWSRKTINLKYAHPGTFGFYAMAPGYSNGIWKGNATAIVSNAASAHPYNQTPRGNNVRKVSFRIKEGNSVKLTATTPLRRSGGGGYTNPPGSW